MCSGYVSLTKIPTKRNSHSQTCLDHISIESELSCISGVVEALISEHDAEFRSVLQKKKKTVTNSLNCMQFGNHSNNSLNAFKYKVAEEFNSFHVYVDFGKDNIILKEKKNINRKTHSLVDDSKLTQLYTRNEYTL